MRMALPRQAVISGGLLHMYGLGVLIVGDSGIGKSESALELIARGHRFISDDVVHVRTSAGGRVIGKAPSLSRYFMELRGLGIINIREIFGPKSIRLQSPIDLVIRLKKWHRKRSSTGSASGFRRTTSSWRGAFPSSTSPSRPAGTSPP